ncbi:MAG: helix-turn-helix domain-containing protein [Thermoplasmatota archaeon]
MPTPACAWCHHATTRYPQIRVQVQQFYARPDGRAVEKVELSGRDWHKVVVDIGAMDTVEDVEVLETEPDRGVVRLSAWNCMLPRAIEASGIVPQTPFLVENGCDTWLLVSAKERAREFYEAARAQASGIEVLYSGEYTPTARLTPRQREVLSRAVEAGYYDYPRRITLTNFAKGMGLAKSTLSQMLMVVESEIIQQSMATRIPRKNRADTGSPAP